MKQTLSGASTKSKGGQSAVTQLVGCRDALLGTRRLWVSSHVQGFRGEAVLLDEANEL